MLRECAQAERVIKEERQAHLAQETTQAQVTALATFEIKEPNDISESPQGIPQITQDKYDKYTPPPSANTQQQWETQTLTQEFMLQCMEIPGYKAPFTARQAALRKYPLQFLCNLAYAVLDNETGNLLKYRHLMKHPKLAQVQGRMDQVIWNRDTPPCHDHRNHLLC